MLELRTKEDLKCETELTKNIIIIDKHKQKDGNISSVEEKENSSIVSWKNSIDLNDPCTWFPISDKIKCYLISKEPDQGRNVNFEVSARDCGNGTIVKFNPSWFDKNKKNGEKMSRTWLIYCKKRQCLYCFPCLLFETDQLSKFSKPEEGFFNWKKLNPKIFEHENKPAHRTNYLKWQKLKSDLKMSASIDRDLQQQILTEKEKWRHVLKAIVETVLFCAQNNIALRGHGQLGEKDCGIFLNLIELISRHDKILAEHLSNNRRVTYLSPQIQNEFIHLLGEYVREKIISDIKEAKYFTIIFDCTPDISHVEQMSQVIRYVDKECNIRESFIDFIDTVDKTGEGLAQVILEKLKHDGLEIENCRGQAYDNGANMVGKYKGVQSHILSIEKFAKFMPCVAHKLNLVGVHAASVSVEMVNFFGIVQQIYVFFSASTTRWDLLTSKYKHKLTLK
ncbi:zinc finger MYM-type protein 1-like [Monomorium pharaonis]|uniref:zinc finger MYM-type protein 1-like n=1 Tax=Monomorium pharaonis TaxID=307658 RepID=UPI001746B7DC|nr:zinc finger MYM-type protein 1-like [Monomorium pharaonis]